MHILFAILTFVILLTTLYIYLVHANFDENKNALVRINDSPAEFFEKSHSNNVLNDGFLLLATQELNPTSSMCHSRDFTQDSDKHASCFFRNLCLIPQLGSKEIDWVYIHDGIIPQDDVGFTLGIGPHSSEEQLHIKPKMMQFSSFFQKYSYVYFHEHPHFIFYEYNAENFGHFLADVLLPIYSILDTFDELTTNIKLIRYQLDNPLGWSCDFQVAYWASLNFHSRSARIRQNCARFYNMLTEMISVSPVSLFGSLFNGSNQVKNIPVCFDKLFVGAPMFSDDCLEGFHGRKRKAWSLCNTGRQKQFWNFRKYTKNNLGTADTLPTTHHIVIWKRKDSKRQLYNLEEWSKKIRIIFGVHVSLINWEEMSIQDQLCLIGNTTVHITGPGGGSFIAIYLPRGATSIRLYPYLDDFGLDYHFLNFLGYIDVKHLFAKDGIIPEIDLIELIESALVRYETFGKSFKTKRKRLSRYELQQKLENQKQLHKKPLLCQSFLDNFSGNIQECLTGLLKARNDFAQWIRSQDFFNFEVPQKEGYGIVICANDKKDIARAIATIKLIKTMFIRSVNFEIHVRSEVVFEQCSQNLLKISCIYIQTHGTIYNAHKPLSLIYSRFQHVIFLDSGTIPMVNPLQIFQDKRYQEHGALFWPDICGYACTKIILKQSSFLCGQTAWPEHAMWRFIEKDWEPIWPFAQEMDSQQLVVDTLRHINLLKHTYKLANDDWVQQVVSEDKDCWRFAWIRNSTQFTMVSKIPGQIGTSNRGGFGRKYKAQYWEKNIMFINNYFDIDPEREHLYIAVAQKKTDMSHCPPCHNYCKLKGYKKTHLSKRNILLLQKWETFFSQHDWYSE